MRLIALLLLATGAFAQPLVIENVTIIDVVSGATSVANVEIRDGRIAAIGKPTPEGVKVVDGRGKFLIPGLWDMHVHLSVVGADVLPVLIRHGITGVRDLGSHLGEVDAMRVKIENGLIVGPRILRAGPALNGQKFNDHQLVPGNPAETRGVARALKQVGVDCFKVHRRMERDSYFALIDEAKKLGLEVVGHIPMTVTPEEASDAGQATIEHTETLFEGTFAAALKEGEDPVAAVRRWREEKGDALFARFVKNGTVVDPTLINYRAERNDAARRMFAELHQVVRRMHRAGVTLVTGTDLAGLRPAGTSLHDELALLVEAGLTPLEALRAATLNPARVLKKDADLGTIAVGKIADLVLLEANPLEDIRNTRKIGAVIANGKLR